MTSKKIAIYLISSLMMVTNAGAVEVRDIWPSTINVTTDIDLKGIVYNETDVTLIGLTITSGSDTSCQFIPADPAKEIDCSVTSSSRFTIDPNDIFGGKNLLALDPNDASLNIDNSDAATVQQPGDYFSLDITGVTITLAPGDYFFSEFRTDATSLVDAEGSAGTVKIYVQDVLIISSGHINTVIRANSNNDPDFSLNGATQTPDRFLIYTTATGNNLNASKAAIAGFLYVDGDSTNSNYFIWGAISAENYGLQNNGWILSGHDYLPQVSGGPGIQNAKIIPAGWHLIGIPALMNGSQTFDDVFNEPEFLVGGQGDGAGWYAYKKTYSMIDNSEFYERVSGTDNPTQSQGYWLWTANDVNWTMDGLSPVVWEIAEGIDQCVPSGGCTSYELTMPSVGCAASGLDGTGPYRYNYVGYPGYDTAADWFDFRIAVTDSNSVRTIFKPGDAAVLTYMSTQIWQYNGTAETSSNTYNTCDNTFDNSCLIEPSTGFVVELNCSLVDDGVQSIELIIPNGQ
ncbi:MAG: hypothetical protein GQ531_08375 [Sulfurovum sp.]|nr:hypothetical protein [Sulfurovum sp.]